MSEIDTTLEHRLNKEKYNFTSSISLCKNEIYDSNISESNFSNKNIVTIKTNPTEIPAASEKFLNTTFYYIGSTTDIYKQYSHYKCVYNTSTSTYSWSLISPTFDENSKTKAEVGGLAKNVDISGKTPLEVLKLILLGNLDPGSIQLPEIDTFYKKGTSTDISLTATCTAPTGTSLSKIEWYKDDDLIYEEALSGTSYESTYTYSSLSSNVILTAKLSLANGTSSSAFRTIKFVNPGYYGIEGSLNEILLDTREALLTFDYGSSFVRPIYKYPASFGTLTRITNSTGQDDYTNSFNFTTETINDEIYNVYTKSTPSVHENFTYQFT